MLLVKKTSELTSALLCLSTQTHPADLSCSPFMSASCFALQLLVGFYYHLHRCHICYFAPKVRSKDIFVHTINRLRCLKHLLGANTAAQGIGRFPVLL